MPNQSRTAPVVRPMPASVRVNLGDWVSPGNARGGLLAKAISVLNTQNPDSLPEGVEAVNSMIGLVRSLLEFKSIVAIEHPSLVGGDTEAKYIDVLAVELLGLCGDVLASLEDIRYEAARSAKGVRHE